MKWDDAEEIALALLETHPDTDPLTVRFTDLHKWVLNLEGFEGKPEDSNEKLLEAIQMAWYEEWKDEYGE
jgi:FeS assembly protein IscX